jgi:N-acetylglutamate synthase-like GNAT family acetyltransferase
MPATPSKVRRRRRGELTVEQTQDPTVITAILERAVMSPAVGESADCFLVAYWGDEPVGITGFDTDVDAALMGPFFVVPQMRSHGVGARLVGALRLAALTRGARRLYAAVPTTSVDYFARFGFTQIDPAELLQAWENKSMLQQLEFDKLAGCRALRADLSWESVVER